MPLFRNVGPVTLIKPGETHFWEYWFDGGREVGVPTATPNMHGEVIAELVVVSEGVVQVPGEDDGGFRIHYTIRIRNSTTQLVDYNLNTGYLA